MYSMCFVLRFDDASFPLSVYYQSLIHGILVGCLHHYFHVHFHFDIPIHIYIRILRVGSQLSAHTIPHHTIPNNGTTTRTTPHTPPFPTHPLRLLRRKLHVLVLHPPHRLTHHHNPRRRLRWHRPQPSLRPQLDPQQRTPARSTRQRHTTQRL